MNSHSPVPGAEQALLFLETGQWLMGRRCVCMPVCSVPPANPEDTADGHAPFSIGIRRAIDFSCEARFHPALSVCGVSCTSIIDTGRLVVLSSY